MLWYSDQIVHIEQIPSRESHESNIDPPLPQSLNDSLKEQGVRSLYLHQEQAISACRVGQNIAVSTAAASGKSLCYNLPVLESLLQDPASRALYLFPTKALAQDQLRSLRSIIPKDSRIKADVFDGDTPFKSRADIRRGSQVVISNPDMLHLGILPNHRSWSRFFRGLKYVIVDEAHVYSGIFGTNVHYIIKRLKRICDNKLQFVAASATLDDAQKFCQQLFGEKMKIIHGSGKKGKTDFVLIINIFSFFHNHNFLPKSSLPFASCMLMSSDCNSLIICFLQLSFFPFFVWPIFVADNAILTKRSSGYL